MRQASRESDALEVDLRYCRSPVEDAQLQQLVGLKDVVVLRLGGSAVSDAGLAHVAKITSLRHLSLEHSAISDAGVAQLAALVELETLNLYGTRVSDASVAQFLKLPKLRRLFRGRNSVDRRRHRSTAGGAAVARHQPQPTRRTPAREDLCGDDDRHDR